MKAPLCALVGALLLGARVVAGDVYDYLKCHLCEVPALTGQIEDCRCDVQSVDQINTRHFLPILHNLTKHTYFRYFKADLWRTCPFWEEDGMCHIRDCAVCECERGEIPACWQEEDSLLSQTTQTRGAALHLASAAALSPARPGYSPGLAGAGGGADGAPLGSDSGFSPSTSEARIAELSRVNFGREGEGAGALHPPPPPSPEWTVEDADSPDSQYVNLLRNPEGYTGYAGPSAARVWRAIYSENCFSQPERAGAAGGEEGQCFEERVFQRVLSGLQTSISTHIAMTYGGGRGTTKDVFQGPNATSASSQAAAAGAGSPFVAAVAAAAAATGLDTLLPALARRLPLPPAYEDLARRLWLRGLSVASGHPERRAAEAQARGRATPAELVLTPGTQPDVDMYLARIGRHPVRMRNLYFTYLFLLRAVDKLRPVLLAADFSVGDQEEDAATRDLVTRLVTVEAPAVLRGFDEGRMFAVAEGAGAAAAAGVSRVSGATGEHAAAVAGGVGGGAEEDGSGAGLVASAHRDFAELAASKAALKASFRDKYRNISRIMDCVGCEKCRLWGKLQFLGLGTAMNILFEEEGAGEGGSSLPRVSRNELVALVNVLHRVSMSLSAVEVMRDLEAQRALHRLLVRGLAGLGALVAALLLARWGVRRRGSGAGAGGAAAAAAGKGASGVGAQTTPAKRSSGGARPEPDARQGFAVGDAVAVGRSSHIGTLVALAGEGEEADNSERLGRGRRWLVEFWDGRAASSSRKAIREIYGEDDMALFPSSRSSSAGKLPPGSSGSTGTGRTPSRRVQ